MILSVTVPSSRLQALRWTADIVLGEVLGLAFEIVEGPEGEVALAAAGRRLAMQSLFPRLDQDRALWAQQLPVPPLAVLDANETLPAAALEEPLPVLFGKPQIESDDGGVRCGIDIFGAVFFMLSRFEEAALPDRDAHDRFPALASLAWKAGFLYRPLVDEYVELLWAMMKQLWPGLGRTRREGRVRVSCDVDQPFDRVGTSPRALLRSVGGDIAKRRDPGLAWRRTRNFFAHRRGDLRFDPYHTFDWYMDTCERHGHRAAFYFIADHSAGAIDGTYEIAEPRVLALLRSMHGRGHEIGMHGSYNTFRNPNQIANERRRLIEACDKAGLEISPDGNRQHYLRWDAAQTPDHLEAAGFGYDTTGSFADRPGFRYGTARPFPMWSFRRNAPLRIRQHPLVLMECSVTAKAYLGMGHTQEALELMHLLKRRSLAHGGDFTLLWHNSEFLKADDRRFFESLLH